MRLILLALVALAAVASVPAAADANAGPPPYVRRNFELDRARPAVSSLVGGVGYVIKFPAKYTLGAPAESAPGGEPTRTTRLLTENKVEIAAAFAGLGVAVSGLWLVRRSQKSSV